MDVLALNPLATAFFEEGLHPMYLGVLNITTLLIVQRFNISIFNPSNPPTKR
jgi:hypothetical protein